MALMGYHFDGLDPKTGTKARYFFSLKDLQVSLARGTSSSLKMYHLSLGATMTDWYDETCELTRAIYDDLIEDSVEIFARNNLRAFTRRQAEILVGHVCHGLAQRVARSLKQLEKVPTGVQPDPSSLNTTSELKLEAPISSSDAMDVLNSDRFGEVLDQLVSSHHFGTHYNLRIRCSHREAKPPKLKTSALIFAVEKLYLLTQRVLASRTRRNKISIISPYLGRIGVIAIGVLVKQWPLLLEIKGRQRLRGDIERKPVVVDARLSIRRIANSLLQVLIPSSLLEHFELVRQEGLDMGFPSNPLVIFTSNAFLYDDHFKVHVADNIGNCLYVVGQHGNSYGVARLNELTPEFRTADYFLSWGWLGDKVLPFGQIKPKVKANFSNVLRGVTLFLVGDPRSVPFADMEGPYGEYHADVVTLCEELDRLKINTEIRLHHQTSRERREFLEKVVDSLPFVKISIKSPPMARLLKSGRAPVFTYDSTGMLELASAGLPFFAFIQEGLKHVRREFIENYRLLEDAGLLSKDPIEAAHLIATWVRATPEIRTLHETAINGFSDGIVFYPTKKLRSLSSLLLHASANGELSSWTER